MGEHVPLLLSMPPPDSVAQVVGCSKGKAAIPMARTCMGRRKHSTGHPCWARGDSVSTVGREEAVSRESIRTQEAEERRLDQMDLWEEGPPVGGSHPHRFERFTASTALSGSTFCKPPALPEVADFFPDVSPQVKSGQQYFREALNLVELGECYGYTHVRTVEHYFQAYGGYSPNPIVFLAAAAQRTHTMRLVTGAVLPVFNNPLKLAGELGMLDAISNGRLDIGVARAFLPLEYAAFGVSMDESRERFEEGFAALRLLLSTENASFDGQFHHFSNITSLPRPVQQP
jgi:hypothetical protein